MSTSRRRFLKSAVAVGGVTLGQRLEALPGSPPGAGGPAARAAGSAAPVQERRLPNMDPGTGIGPDGYGALDENSVHYVAIRVKPKNFETAVKRVSDALGLEFEYLGGETSGIRMALAMEARIEIVTTASDNVDTTATDAAAYPAVMAARDMATKGEGAYLSVFGVKDIDAAVARAEQAGVRTVARYEVDQRLPADSRFSVFREAMLEEMYGMNFCLRQIEEK